MGGFGINEAMNIGAGLLNMLAQAQAEKEARIGNQGVQAGLTTLLTGMGFTPELTQNAQLENLFANRDIYDLYGRSLGSIDELSARQQAMSTNKWTNLLGQFNAASAQDVKELENLQTQLQGSYGSYGNALQQNAAQRQLDLLSDYRQKAEGLSGWATGLTGEARQRSTDILGEWDKRAGEITSGYERRYADVMQGLSGLGEQERKDLAEAYQQRESNVMADLRRKGMGTTGMTTTAGLGVEREKQADVRRLEDQLTRERMGYQTQLSGETLAAKEAQQASRANLASGLTSDVLGYGSQALNLATQLGMGYNTMLGNLTGEQLNLQGTLGQNAWNLQQQSGQNLLNLMSGIRSQRTGMLEGQAVEAQNLGAQYGQQRLGMDVDLTNQLYNMIAGISNTYPSESNYLQTMTGSGFGSVEPWTPKQSSGLFGGSGGIFGAAGVAGGGAILSSALGAPFNPALFAADLGLGYGLGSMLDR